MENNIFSDIKTSLDLNGPVLSWLEQPTLESTTLTISPATPGGDTLLDLSSSTAIADFASNKEYTLTSNGTFTSVVTLDGAAGGSYSNVSTGRGLGGNVKGVVHFEKDQVYKLVTGKLGADLPDAVNNGGIGAGGTSYGGNNTSGGTSTWTYWEDGMSSNWNSSGNTLSNTYDYLLTPMPKSGKWYFETVITGTPAGSENTRYRTYGFSRGAWSEEGYDDNQFAIYDNGLPSYLQGAGASGVVLVRDSNGTVASKPYNNITRAGAGWSHSTVCGVPKWQMGDTINWAYDADNGNIWMGRNGEWFIPPVWNGEGAVQGNPVKNLWPIISGAPLSNWDSGGDYYFKIGAATITDCKLQNVVKSDANYTSLITVPDNAGCAGGGYTGLFKSSVSQANALLIAGGGGGGERGGNGGDSDGEAENGGSTNEAQYAGGSSGGRAGTRTAGGAAGVGDGKHIGEAGSALQGGSTSNTNPFYAGNGGGGGYFGGGAGAGVDSSSIASSDQDTGGGGGGGSSFYSSDLTSVSGGEYGLATNASGGKVRMTGGSSLGGTVVLSGLATAFFPRSGSISTAPTTSGGALIIKSLGDDITGIFSGTTGSEEFNFYSSSNGVNWNWLSKGNSGLTTGKYLALGGGITSIRSFTPVYGGGYRYSLYNTDSSFDSVGDIIVDTTSLTYVGMSTFGKGYIDYQWYQNVLGQSVKLTDISGRTGSATTTLTLSDLTSITNNTEYYITADYVPSSYYETGNANNEVLSSDGLTITVVPEIEIISQPTSKDTTTDKDVEFSVGAQLTDNSSTGALGYQWRLNGVNAYDGVNTKYATGGESIQNTYTGFEDSVTIPPNATNILITIAGASGGQGGRDASGPGGAGGKGRVGTFTLEPKSTEYKLWARCGKQGDGGTSGNHSAGGGAGKSNVSAGGGGGGAGQNGWSGGGGGGGGATGIYEDDIGFIIVAAGGGGGGGGSWNVGAPAGANAGMWESDSKMRRQGDSRTTKSDFKNAQNGSTKSGDGGGGGGGGGGVSQGTSGGAAGQDNSHGGDGGQGGESRYDDARVTLTSSESGDTNSGNGYVNISYDTAAKLTVTGDQSGNVSTVDISKIDKYQAFNTEGTYTVVADGDIQVRFYIRGAGGGFSQQYNGRGGKGGYAQGTVNLTKGTSYKLLVGNLGEDGGNGGSGGYGGGGNGGAGEGRGGGGGGYSGLFVNSITWENALLIAGGGGGGSNDYSDGTCYGGNGGGQGLPSNPEANGYGGNAANAGERGGMGGGIPGGAGGAGGTNEGSGAPGGRLQGGPGSAGGGGGYFGGGGVVAADFAGADGAGGGGMGYVKQTVITNGDFSKSGIYRDDTGLNSQVGSIVMEYAGSVDITNETTVSGSRTSAMTVKSSSVGIQTVDCIISHPTASNSPFISDVVNYNVLSTVDDKVIHIEAIGTASDASLSTINLVNGDFTFTTTNSSVDAQRVTNLYSFYSPDKDIEVEMDLYGGKGSNSIHEGGEGGYTRIRFTMKEKEEFVIAGLSTAINAPYLYRKGSLIACVGEGGHGGLKGPGGQGGGIGIDGETGGGRGGGLRATQISGGTLSADGQFGSFYTSSLLYPGDIQLEGNKGGRSIKCTKGVHWAEEGFSACQDLGTPQFKLPDGTAVTNTAGNITRGYKPGYNIIQTAGAPVGAGGGRGGNGCTGGNGGETQAGGGGGSGYSDGSVNIISNTLGGSTGNAKVVMRFV